MAFWLHKEVELLTIALHWCLCYTQLGENRNLSHNKHETLLTSPLAGTGLVIAVTFVIGTYHQTQTDVVTYKSVASFQQTVLQSHWDVPLLSA
jgi:hypothetical protein